MLGPSKEILFQMKAIFPLHRSDFAEHHPLFYKPGGEYFVTYTNPVRMALEAAGVELVSPGHPLDIYKVQFENGVNLGVCYSDYPDLSNWDDVEGIDAIMKMKFHPERYPNGWMDRARYPVLPGGFCFAIGGGLGDTQEFISKTLPGLRARKDFEEQTEEVLMRGSFRIFRLKLPNRVQFNQFFKGADHSKVSPDQYMNEIASYRYALNVCGNGYSIDRKVVEYCAIGTAIISDRGLEDLELPFGKRFVHGENIWFIEGPQDVEKATEQIGTGDLWRKLVDGSRRLYESCFSPEALGEWYMQCMNMKISK